jgi:hypothetical protein
VFEVEISPDWLSHRLNPGLNPGHTPFVGTRKPASLSPFTVAGITRYRRHGRDENSGTGLFTGKVTIMGQAENGIAPVHNREKLTLSARCPSKNNNLRILPKFYAIFKGRAMA